MDEEHCQEELKKEVDESYRVDLQGVALLSLSIVDMFAMVFGFTGVVCLASFALGVMFTERYLRP